VLKKSDAEGRQQYTKPRDSLGVSSLLPRAPSRIIPSSDPRRRTFSTESVESGHQTLGLAYNIVRRGAVYYCAAIVLVVTGSF